MLSQGHLSVKQGYIVHTVQEPLLAMWSRDSPTAQWRVTEASARFERRRRLPLRVHVRQQDFRRRPRDSTVGLRKPAPTRML